MVQHFKKNVKNSCSKIRSIARGIHANSRECGLNVDSLFLEESADLLFHYLVLLKAKGFELNTVLSILKRRNKQ
ncbi:MAG: hypothetical protein K9G40_07130 [Crocinitomicaceae bacterium]|nr:hypothetical protein [Crocinitomicaceae bacterium]MCF8434646.1 hypothetical protein [Crocinitomicaceae bacterium]